MAMMTSNTDRLKRQMSSMMDLEDDDEDEKQPKKKKGPKSKSKSMTTRLKEMQNC